MMEHGRVLHHDSKADLSSGACATDGSGTADHGNVSAGLVCTQNNARLLDATHMLATCDWSILAKLIN